MKDGNQQQSNTVDLLLHPARLLIIQTLLQEPGKSAGDLCALLPELPQASVYRHIALLRDGGILHVEEGRNERNRKEQKYSLVEGAALMKPEKFMAMGHAGRTALFVQYLAALQAAFTQWSASADADPVKDGVGFRQGLLWLSDSEFQAMMQEVGEVFEKYLQLPRAPERKLRTINTIVLPRSVDNETK